MKYTKKQLIEAIQYWEEKLQQLNEIKSNDDNSYLDDKAKKKLFDILQYGDIGKKNVETLTGANCPIRIGQLVDIINKYKEMYKEHDIDGVITMHYNNEKNSLNGYESLLDVINTSISNNTIIFHVAESSTGEGGILGIDDVLQLSKEHSDKQFFFNDVETNKSYSPETLDIDIDFDNGYDENGNAGYSLELNFYVDK